MKSLKLFFLTGCIVLSLFFLVSIPSASAATYATTWCKNSWPFRDWVNYPYTTVFSHIVCGEAMSYVYDVSLDKSVYLVNENVRASGTYIQAYNAWRSPYSYSSTNPLYEGSSIMARNDHNYDYRFLFGGGCASISYNTCAAYGYAQAGFGTSGAVSFTAPPYPMNSSVTFFGERFNYYDGPAYGLAGVNPGGYGTALLASNFPDAVGSYRYGYNPYYVTPYPFPIGGSYSLSNYAGYNSYYGTEQYVFNGIYSNFGFGIHPGSDAGYNYIASIPYTVCASNYQSSCSATSYYTNACGQTNTSRGSFRCDGSCSVGPPPPPDNPPGYSSSCAYNSCGDPNGYIQCSGSCSASPVERSYYHTACQLTSAPNV